MGSEETGEEQDYIRDRHRAGGNRRTEKHDQIRRTLIKLRTLASFMPLRLAVSTSQNREARTHVNRLAGTAYGSGTTLLLLSRPPSSEGGRPMMSYWPPYDTKVL